MFVIQMISKFQFYIIQSKMYEMVYDWLWLIILVGYFLISTFFLCFPNILHKRKHFSYNAFNQIIEDKKIFCVGHRGAAYQAPQNTLQGFDHAAKTCDIFEMDICGTKDGKIVINHDQNFLRTTGIDKYIYQLNYDQLPTLQDQYVPYCADFLLKTTNNKIPLLEDLLKQYPKMPMSIELKTPLLKPTGEHKTQDWPIRQVNRLIKKYQREDITIWGHEFDENNSKMYEANKNILNFYSQPQIKRIIILFLLGLLPFACLRQGCAFLPLVSNVMRKELQPQSKFQRRLKMAFYHFFNFLMRCFISHLHKRGIISLFFTVNQKCEFEEAASIGCLGIISDRPTDLARFLKERCLNVSSNNELSHNQLIK